MNTGAWMQKLKHIKGLPYIALALAAGIVLLLLPSGSGHESTVSASLGDTYRASLEQEVADLLCEMEGVESCRVVLTLASGYEYTYATDQRVTEHEGGKETEKTVVLATQSGGEEPILLREKLPIVLGIAVVCPGADYVACARIKELLCALFALSDEQISIQT